ncbi:metalloregulator ArsR/SmtB family transcription factor [Erythrobacter arachoides]|uniref:Metalloregulator ArsR/SmtB family transcription factor n=1 Tax=Aurantiacibacter arachoides TaxID=1850444 RepID=A0A845A366_9SPHN|nr:metalloregulator ArsR/SmtB family transcription factor [Aurantiacibacter arachoides]MXO93862.1 metalloregulator ArsR/SmtB family transcription factor [Aurantiacibacter arachoides]GGD46125.1 transcriptional regulator [Aurantiacibacter arachoides]
MEIAVNQVEPPNTDFIRQAGEASRLLKVMANECRLLILCFLAKAGELSVGQLTERVGLSQSALSQHLAKLRDEGLVATRKVSQSVFYRVCDPKAEQVLALLHQLYCPELGPEPGQDRGADTRTGETV